MSTKALKEALDLLAEEPAENYATLLAAREELEAIERAAKEWVSVDGQPGPGKMARLDALLRLIAEEAS